MRSDFNLPTKRLLASGLIVFALSIALTPQSVQAQPIRVAGQQVFQVNTGTNDLSTNKRAEAIQTNLDNAIVASKEKGSQTVGIIYVSGLPVITLAGYQICTVDALDAKDASTTPALLAQRWSDGLKKSMADKKSVASYIAQLSSAGDNSSDNGGNNNNNGNNSNSNNSSSSSSSNGNNSSNSNNNSTSNGIGSNSANSGNYSNNSSSYNPPDTYATSPSVPSSAPPLQAQQPAYAQPPLQQGNGGTGNNAAYGLHFVRSTGGKLWCAARQLFTATTSLRSTAKSKPGTAILWRRAERLCGYRSRWYCDFSDVEDFDINRRSAKRRPC